MSLTEYGAIVAAGYLLGALPTGYLLGRVAKNIDVRRYGSGSTGATNVLRILGWGAAAVVFIGDFGKGFLAVWGAGALGAGPLGQAVAGLAALVGHNWPVFLGFAGGRGVASGIGGLFAMVPLGAAVCMAVALAVMAVTRYVSLGSVIGTLLSVPLAVAAVLVGAAPAEYLVYVLPGVTLIVARHRANIERLLRGTERRLGESVKVEAPGAAKRPGKGRTRQRRAPVG